MGYANPSETLKRLLSEENRKIESINSLKLANPYFQRAHRGGVSRVTLISENGLYEVCTQSELKNPQIKEFKQWMFNTISRIRQNGFYMNESIIDPRVNKYSEFSNVLYDCINKSTDSEYFVFLSFFNFPILFFNPLLIGRITFLLIILLTMF